MANDFRQVDEHGFPVPPRFADFLYHADEQPKRPKISLRAKRLAILAVLVLVIVPVVFGPQIVSTGRELLAHWLAGRAERKLLEGDSAGALADLNAAIDWNSDAWQLYHDRAEVHEQMQDLNGSVADYTKSIEMLEGRENRRFRRDMEFSSTDVLARMHAHRSILYVRLNRGREAIDDATKALSYERSPAYYNNRAYVRALANMELSEGLADIDQALADRGGEERSGEFADFLDTRGYLLHLLDRNEEAIKDLDRAVRIKQELNRTLMFRQLGFDPRLVEFAMSEIREGLAVMHHHRGLVNEKLGRKEEAKRDLLKGDQLGYNPALGVF